MLKQKMILAMLAMVPLALATNGNDNAGDDNGNINGNNNLSEEDAKKLAEKMFPSRTPESDQIDMLMGKLEKIEEELQNKNPQASEEELKDKIEAVIKDEVVKNSFHIQDLCPDRHPTDCDPKAFQSIDGRCNNIEKGLWGSTLIALRRFLPSEYSAKRGSIPRGGKRSMLNLVPENERGRDPDVNRMATKCLKDPRSPLPSPRLIVNTLGPDTDNNMDMRHTSMLMQFGQFLVHDISLTPGSRSRTGDCCADDSQNECFPIRVPEGDKIFPNKCNRNFGRSGQFCRKPFSAREQMNSITSLVDASAVYGSSGFVARNLRLHREGKMRVSTDGNELLPRQGAGDFRNGAQPTLKALHTLFLREHNRLARAIAPAFPDDDERIYQEARRLVIAQFQNIVYNEYLPVILGEQRARDAGISTKTGRTKYDPNVDPSMRNSIAAAALRYGHSQIQALYESHDGRDGHLVELLRLRQIFFNDTSYRESGGRGCDRLLAGLAIQPVQAVDTHFNIDITERLFRFPNDLISINIQRGRDHGIPSYNEFRKFCRMRPICSWNRKPDEISGENWEVLKALYRHPKDIDLYVGGISEDPAFGGVIGKTFNCLNTKQFRATRDGDRFFFTHASPADNPRTFSDSQVNTIRKRRLSDLMCDNTDLKRIPGNVFETGSAEICCGGDGHNFLDGSQFVSP